MCSVVVKSDCFENDLQRKNPRTPKTISIKFFLVSLQYPGGWWLYGRLTRAYFAGVCERVRNRTLKENRKNNAAKKKIEKKITNGHYIDIYAGTT